MKVTSDQCGYVAVYDEEVKAWASICMKWDIAMMGDTAEEALDNAQAAVNDILEHEGEAGLLALGYDDLAEFVRQGNGNIVYRLWFT